MRALARKLSLWHKKTTMEKHNIDAEGKSLGRVASAAAKALIGKENTAFAKNVVSPCVVEIRNASKVLLSGTKMNTKRYSRYSGYPGGLKKVQVRQVLATKGYPEILRKAIYGMLPKNKLRTRRMKQLVISQ